MLKKLKDDDFLVITGRMINSEEDGGLGLSGATLLVYARIYPYCINKAGAFWGGEKFLAKWAGITERQVRNILENLSQRQLIQIEKRVGKTDLITLVGEEPYDVTPEKSSPPPRKKVHHPTENNSAVGVRKSIPHNELYNDSLNIKENLKENATSTDVVVASTDAPLPPESESRESFKKGSLDFKDVKNPRVVNSQKISVDDVTLADIRIYCKNKNITVDPQKFWEYYTKTVVDAGQKPWTDKNGRKVKNWKLKLMTWDSFSKPQNSQVSNNVSAQSLKTFVDATPKTGGKREDWLREIEEAKRECENVR